MSLRTRRGVALMASLLLVAVACTGGTATQAPTSQAPPAASSTAAASNAEPTDAEPTDAESVEPSGPAESPSEPAGSPSEPAGSPSEPAGSPSEPAGSPSEPAGSPSESPGTGIDDLLFGSEYAPTEGTPGGTVVIADWQIPDQMNPYYSNAFVNTQVFASTMKGLWTVSHDGKWVPDLGVTVPRVSDDTVRIEEEKGDCPEEAQQGDTPGFEIDLDIKPGLLWSDGETLDLNDLSYTWQWNIDPDQTGLSGGTTGWDLIDSFEVEPDGLSATVHFCTGFAGFYGVLASPILPQHYMETIPIADAAEQSYPVGPAAVDAPVSGPFQYASLSPSSIELVRNENFRGGVSGRAAPAYLDRVIYRFFEGAKDAMIAAAINGELDVATDLLQFDVPALEGQLPATHELLVDVAWEYEHFDMNQQDREPGRGHPALADPAVRTALSMAIDKAALYQAVSPGAEPPEEACSPVAPGLYYRSTEDLTCVVYDPAGAATMLDEAGWVDTNGDGTRDKDGLELSLLHCHTGAPFRVTSGDFLASAFREIGVELLNTPAPETVFAGWNEVENDAECNLSHGNYDTSEFAWVQTFDLFGSFYGYHSSRIPTDENNGEGNNYVRLNDETMDEVLDRLFGATDPADQAAIGAEFQSLHTELQPETVLYYRSSARVVNANLENFFKNPGTSSDMWNIEDWYLSTP